jgi:hypothetical protein
MRHRSRGAQAPEFLQSKSFVTAGLDPVVRSDLRLRDLSANQIERLIRMDCRVKPGNDERKKEGGTPADV